MSRWTDQEIRVHMAHCVLALMMARLTEREAAGAGVAMRERALGPTLGGIEETVPLHKGE